MKIAVLAHADTRREILSKPAAPDILWEWMDHPGQFTTHRDAAAYFDLQFEFNPMRTALLSGLLPKPVFINAVTNTLAEIGMPFIRINAWPGFIGRPVVELSAGSPEGAKDAQHLFEALQWDYRLVPDLPGMISPRVISCIINEAYITYETGISSREDIDAAMKLGTNYPYGPFEWAGRIGLEKIYHLMTELGKTNERYRVSECIIRELGLPTP